jgi:hypothetical protein
VSAMFLFCLKMSGLLMRTMQFFFVVVGRPIIYGLALGDEGVEQVVWGLLTDTEVTLGLSGYKGINEIWGKGKLLWRRWRSQADVSGCVLDYGVAHLFVPM